MSELFTIKIAKEEGRKKERRKKERRKKRITLVLFGCSSSESDSIKYLFGEDDTSGSESILKFLISPDSLFSLDADSTICKL